MKKIIILLFSFSAVVFSQELNCKVTVNTESLPIVNKDLVRNFASVIEDYMNKTRFTDSWEGGKIDCSLDIFFISASSEINYTAQVVVTSIRPIYKSNDNSLMLSINDNAWNFVYERNQALYSNQSTFDPITSFLDYYAYIIIGFDMDSWQELGGTPYFKKAMDIVNLGANSRFSNGWQKTSGGYSRRGLVDNLLDEKYRPFRESLYDYFYGIDIFAQNKKAGTEKILKLISTLESMKNKIDFSSVLLKTFFDAKSGEIIAYLKDYPDKTIFKTLRKIDPGHMSKYNEALNK